MTTDIPTIAHTLTFQTNTVSTTIIIFITTTSSMNIIPTRGSNENIFIQSKLTVRTHPVAVTNTLILDAQSLSMAFFIFRAIATSPLYTTNIYSVGRSVN